VIETRRNIVISKIKPKALRTALDLAEKGEENRIILLSDAGFMLLNAELAGTLKKASSNGVRIYALRNDIKKRGIEEQPYLKVVDYNSLVDKLLEPDTKTVNL